MRFQSKVVLITGAAGGLGEASTRRFASEGANLILTDLDREKVETLAAKCRAEYGSSVITSAGDVSEEAVVNDVVQAGLNAFGRIDILFNNAGINPTGNVVDTPLAVWDLTMKVNLRSAFLMTSRVIPSMIEAGGGVIVNTASIASFKASTNEAAYSVSKAALLQLTKVTARDFADSNIRVNAVCPGILENFMADRKVISSEEMMAKRRARVREIVPFKREGRYEEIANLVAFLACDESSYVTGAAFTADGGLTV
jgi:NAD(P)-dependent dehydrogenase (short-subunit alcohol dehydrogenase family)